MSDIMLKEPIELTETELDFVCGGAANAGAAAGAVGLVAAAVGAAVAVENVANNNTVLSNNHIPVAVAVVL